MANREEALSQGWQFLHRGDFQQAASVGRQILGANAADFDALCLLAGCCLAQGQLTEAADYCRRAIRLSPGDVSLLNSLGVALARQGALDEAQVHFSEVLRLTPNSSEAHNNLGLVLKDRGRPQEAEAHFREALRVSPDFSQAYNNLGLALKEQGRFQEALESLQQSLRLAPDSPEGHNNLALVLKELDRLDEAEASYRRALALRPNYPEAHSNLGNVLKQQQRFDEAVASFHRAIQCRPYYPEAYSNLGLAFKEQGKLDEALGSLRQALRLKPDFAEVYSNVAVVLQEQGKLEEAESNYRQAIRLKPDAAELHGNLALVLHEQGRLEEALACEREVIRLKPESADGHTDLGTVLKDLGRFEEAEACYQHALRLQPDNAHCHHALGMLLLLRGDFRRGWAEHEWRLCLKKPAPARPPFRQPQWDGSSLEGKTILLYAEQGLGDTLHFVRYAAMVKQRGGTVLLECPASLIPLLGRCAGVDRAVAAGSPLPEFDFQVPLLSLPSIFATELDRGPYIETDARQVESWRRELAAIAGFKVGIVWQGNPRHHRDRQRSVPLEHFAPLAQLSGVQLLSLQKGPGAEQLPRLAASFPVIDLGSRLDETSAAFCDTAAVMQGLDLVITVDTAMAHLAGALGVPVWVALAALPDWRWMLDRNDSPWYPTMRLFRQRKEGERHGVFQQIKTALCERLFLARTQGLSETNGRPGKQAGLSR